ncbi:hypothetical protein [Sporosarcina highlanderae]|uniref:Uncharacterized protein n=1 Tax=Sporosarcina highlanderae TaxID=3035916 RepID=A0ABT8JWJ0_9BACL|nr:hypothetical protein [Sporosarcina highlanderae]MDN4609232.1 hypothetical protein [Sporosarcina highlanderae]
MGKVALIQNQVYMSYSTKSDIRPLLEGFDSIESEDIILYTAHNIPRLKFDLTDMDITMVIFTSNSLSENIIRGEVESEPFKRSFEEFLSKGKGCLILHQLNSIPKGVFDPFTAYNFLPIEAPKAVRRKEDPIKGDLRNSILSEAHPVFHYPNNVSLEELKQYCMRKKGLYWHYLDDSHCSVEWETLLHDENEAQTRRALLMATRETSKYRVVISSLNLDWQQETVLLENIIKFVSDGKCNTAILRDSTYKSMAFEFFLETLSSLNYRYQEYDLSTINQIEEFKKQIMKGTHSIVVLGPTHLDVENEKQEKLKEIEHFLQEYIVSGNIKYIGIESNDLNLKQFFVAGREKSALRILQDTEFKIHGILKEGNYIDDSFWSTVDTLKTHKALEKRNVSYTKFTSDFVKPILDKEKERDSFNGLLVPTSALLWLRANYGDDQERLQSTVDWMKKALLSGEEAESECIVAYNTFLEQGIETELATKQLKRLIRGKDLTNCNEIEIIHYIKAAILLRDIQLIKQFVITLEAKKNSENLWIDISVSATILNLLLEALVVLKEHEEDTKDIEKTIENLVFPTIIYIQKLSNRNNGVLENYFHWDNKANTTLKCISAILNLEDLMDIPVTEMVQSLISYSRTSNQILDNKTAFKVIDDYKNDMSALTKKNKQLEERVQAEVEKQKGLEEEKESLLNMNNRLTNMNLEYDEQIRKNDFQLNFWKIVIILGVTSLITLLFAVIYLFNYPKIYVDIIEFYKQYSINLPAVIGTIFTLLVGVTTTNYFRKKRNTTGMWEGKK